MANNDNVFQFKGSLFTLTVLHLYDDDTDKFSTQLFTTIQKTPKFFEYAPVVIDLQHLLHPEKIVNFAFINEQLRTNHLIPIGIKGGNKEQNDAAIAAGFAILPKLKPEPQTKRSNRVSPGEKLVKPTVTTSPTSPTKIVTQPIRSGQQIYAKGGDLCVIAPVSHGAELLADGNIHIYGSLRGRALAGVNGDTNARIFCQFIDAELVSIAGHYLLNDQLNALPNKDNVQVYLQDERIQINSLTTK